MSESLRHLAMRIRNELLKIEHALKRAEEGINRAKETGDDYYLDGVALNLHSFYSGIERIFELIAGNIDDIVPEGENWHQILLKQMAEEMNQVRPAVISDSVTVQQNLSRRCSFSMQLNSNVPHYVCGHSKPGIPGNI
jgi:hypothetical protein